MSETTKLKTPEQLRSDIEFMSGPLWWASHGPPCAFCGHSYSVHGEERKRRGWAPCGCVYSAGDRLPSGKVLRSSLECDCPGFVLSLSSWPRFDDGHYWIHDCAKPCPGCGSFCTHWCKARLPNPDDAFLVCRIEHERLGK